MNKYCPMVAFAGLVIAFATLGCGRETEEIAILAKGTYVHIYTVMQDRPWPECLLVCGKPQDQPRPHTFMSVADLTEEEMTFALSVLAPVLMEDRPAKIDPIDIYFVTVVTPEETWDSRLQASQDSLELLYRLSDTLEKEHREALVGVILQTRLMIEYRADSAEN